MSETRLLHKPSVSRSRKEIPPDEETGLRIGNYGPKAQAVLPSAFHCCLIEKPLKRVMNSPETVGRMALWAVELSEFDIQYHPQTAIKGQVVADFIAKFTLMDDQGAKKIPQWNIYTDGSSNKQVKGAGVVLFSPEQDKIECMV